LEISPLVLCFHLASTIIIGKTRHTRAFGIEQGSRTPL
jgi:hypothetical protein